MSPAVREIVDELDGRPAAETVRFGPEGRDYAMALTEDTAPRLGDASTAYAAVARTAGAYLACAPGAAYRRHLRDRRHCTELERHPGRLGTPPASSALSGWPAAGCLSRRPPGLWCPPLTRQWRPSSSL